MKKIKNDFSKFKRIQLRILKKNEELIDKNVSNSGCVDIPSCEDSGAVPDITRMSNVLDIT